MTIHFYSTDTNAHLLSSDQMELDIAINTPLTIRVKTQEHEIEYKYYVDAVEIGNTYKIVFVSLQGITTK